MDIVSEENKRTIQLKSGNKVIITRKDPYGFCYISFERGAIPKELDSTFTSFPLAIRTIEKWMQDNDKVAGTPDVAPDFKYKRSKKLLETQTSVEIED
jgi:hypothetical protein